MSKPLVIVESPTKVRTLKKYLGNDYKVEATVGHIMDLPRKELGIDIEHGFEPEYQVIQGKTKVVNALKKAAQQSEDVYLAPDPDREGEAIAWHASQVLQKKGRRFHRVLFHELTKNAILKAMSDPKDLDESKYNAQQVRRLLDRLVGYKVSPLLWRKVKGGLSAGRVQSVALRIICERERAIQAFEPEEYWTITAHMAREDGPVFPARLTKKNGKKVRIPDQKTADGIVSDVTGQPFAVDKVNRKTVKKNPAPPFTTSKLQQDAIRKLRFSAKKTMRLAQELYEGLELGPGEQVGLITYMRTDSIRIADEAAQEALEYIGNEFGPDYKLAKPRHFKNSKKVQDAHEAIRPTSVMRTPQQVAPYLSADQLTLYRLIWQRFVASQMQPALVDQTTVYIKNGPYTFHASGSIMKFPGFTAVYQSAEDLEKKAEDTLPPVEAGDELGCEKIEPRQHFTQPPPRFNEASLVKELEENGIGRPSTYATILSTIRDKAYVELLKGHFRPTELGLIVNDLLVHSFGDVFDVAFTAQMEDNLDRIEANQADAIKILEDFYESFKEDLEAAGDKMVSMKGVGLPTHLKCPECGSTLHVKIGKNGTFLACSAYPECHYTTNYTRDEKGEILPEKPSEEKPTDEVCEKCGRPMVLRQGRYGEFLACSGYPECRNTRNPQGPHGGTTGVKCPEKDCGGELVEKKSKRGKIFYGCNNYPQCTYAVWEKPVARPCPDCDSPILVEKTSKKKGTFLKCPVKGCKYEEIIAPPEE
ncbi:MAG: type I DNA topoisomerase [Desulfatibacillaceae bacterium]